MKQKLIILLLGILLPSWLQAQFRVNYDPSVQSTAGMQYFVPAGGNQFVGDCIPFFHNGTYYLYWLLDEGHHSSLNGLGGHQWVVSTTTDLKHWTHHPIVIGIDQEWEKSICTGSVAFYNNKYYAFYATRLIDSNNQVNEQLSYAISSDGIHFEKQTPNPFYTSAPGYSKRSFRDPKVVVDPDGTFHLFITSSTDNYLIGEGRGCLVHLTSKDLKQWNVLEPLLSGQRDDPECPDYFFWKGWYYLIYGQGGNTYYVKSRHPYGPWEYPHTQALIEQWVNVAKTAAFHNDRRIAAGWIPSKNESKDNGYERFGGNIVLREITQLPNGDLSTKFPAEVIPAVEAPLNRPLLASGNAVAKGNDAVLINAPGAIGGAYFENIPADCRVILEIEPQGNNNEYGLFLRADSKAEDGYKLSFSPNLQTVSLFYNARIDAVSGLDKPLQVEIIMQGDIIDVCVNNSRCMVNRLIEKKGNCLWFYAKQGKVNFKNIRVYPLK